MVQYDLNSLTNQCKLIQQVMLIANSTILGWSNWIIMFMLVAIVLTSKLSF